MPTATLYKFQQQLTAANVDEANGVIREVSLISLGEAKGHGIYIDKTTLRQVFEFCVSAESIKVKEDHGSGVFATIGYIDEFRMEKDKVTGTFHVYESEQERARIFEIAEKQPKHMGLSLEFSGIDEDIGGKKFARCEEISAVALVSDPAANKSLFSKKDVAKEQEFKRKDSDMSAKALEQNKLLKKQFASLKECMQGMLDGITAIQTALNGQSEGGESEMEDEDQDDIVVSDKDKKEDAPDPVDPSTQPVTDSDSTTVEDDVETENETDAEEGDEDEPEDKKEKAMSDKKTQKKLSKEEQDRAEFKRLAAKLGMRVMPAAGAPADSKKEEKKDFQTLLDEKTKELGAGKSGDAIKFCINTYPAEYAEYRKKFLSVKAA